MSEQSVAALDQGQYSLDEIRKYEAIYGRNFISPGGEATARAILGLVAFTPNMDVLDVGCGLGGAAFLIAQTYGARVHGIDLSRNMLQIAQARCREAQLTHAGHVRARRYIALRTPSPALIWCIAAMSFCIFTIKLACSMRSGAVCALAGCCCSAIISAAPARRARISRRTFRSRVRSTVARRISRSAGAGRLRCAAGAGSHRRLYRGFLSVSLRSLRPASLTIPSAPRWRKVGATRSAHTRGRAALGRMYGAEA